MQTIDSVVLFKWFKTEEEATLFAEGLDSGRLVSVDFK